MKKEFDKLASTIKKLGKGKRAIYYIPSIWNYGDCLINFWTELFFKYYNIKVKVINHYFLKGKMRFLKDDSLFIYWWWGWWTKIWGASSYNLVNFIKYNKVRSDVLVLPSTYERGYFIKWVTFFARDKFDSLQNMSRSVFCHDMAFFLFILKDIPYNKENFYRSEVGLFFRTDKESSRTVKIYTGNIDLSLYWNSLSDISYFLSFIDSFNIIYTDRLHIWIAGILLWKKVYLYSSSYFKIPSIYKSSIEPYFNNVIFNNISVLNNISNKINKEAYHRNLKKLKIIKVKNKFITLLNTLKTVF